MKSIIFYILFSFSFLAAVTAGPLSYAACVGLCTAVCSAAIPVPGSTAYCIYGVCVPACTTTGALPIP
uniref:Uncharacterized protein n=1 Tax=Acrobeloides nanus TaxID=290746 RepID=A0A914D5B2_9BILA